MSFKPARGVTSAVLEPEVATGAIDVAKMVLAEPARTGTSSSAASKKL